MSKRKRYTLIRFSTDPRTPQEPDDAVMLQAGRFGHKKCYRNSAKNFSWAYERDQIEE